MFKWIISLILIIICVPIVYFNIMSFYSSKRDFKKNEQQFNNQATIKVVKDNNKTKKDNSFEKEFDNFNKSFEKDWKNF